MTCTPSYPVRCSIAHRALLLALLILTSFTLPLSAQNRDLRAGLILEDQSARIDSVEYGPRNFDKDHVISGPGERPADYASHCSRADDCDFHSAQTS